MPVRFSKKTRPSTSRKSRPIRRKKVPKGSKTLVTKAQLYRAIRRNVETKMASYLYGYTGFNSAITATTGDMINFLPQIQEGTAQNQRIGHQIKPLKLVIRGFVNFFNPGANNIQASSIGARLFCYQDKATRSYTSSVFNSELLDIGGNGQSFVGNTIDYVLPHNNDQFTFYLDKKMRMLKPFGLMNSGSAIITAGGTPDMISTGSGLFQPFTITLTQKQLPSQLKYDPAESSIWPVNFAPRISLGYCDLFNFSPDTLTTKLAMEFCATLYYEDA